MTAAVSAVPLTPAFGVELRGLDPNRLDAAQASVFREAFLRDRIVLLRGCELAEESNVRLTESLGPATTNATSGQRFSYVSNVHPEGLLGEGQLPLHADFMFMEQPALAISLYAMVLPVHGGETIFADAAAAYRRLPEALKKRIAGLHARYVTNYTDGRPTFDPHAPGAMMAIHPLAWQPPQARCPVLYASKLMTESIVGMSADESEALLQELFAHVEDPRVQYVHRWQPGDYLVWDNRCLQHARRDFASPDARTLRRVVISG
jgi:taurine dioxygenase